MTPRNITGQTTTTTGTGTLTLGSAITESDGRKLVALGAGDDGKLFSILILASDGEQEVAEGCTYTHSGTTMTRGTLATSSTGSALNLPSGTHKVYVVATAGKTTNYAPLNFETAAHMAYLDVDTITIKAGRGIVNGTSLAWADTNKDCGPSGTSPMNAAGIKYVYLENSSGTAAFAVSTTAPTWDADLEYYKGSSANQRLIGWIYVWHATNGSEYRIVPFTAAYRGRECQINYSGDLKDNAGTDDLLTNAGFRIVNGATSTSSTHTMTSVAYSSYVPTVCHDVRLIVTFQSSVTGDRCFVGTAAMDRDSGVAAFAAHCENVVSLDSTANTLQYMPSLWQATDLSGSIYYAVSRLSGTGTVTSYIDVFGGRLWV